MVLNQRQVLVIVSDWEPYLGSLFSVGVCEWLFSVCVAVLDGTVLVVTLLFCIFEVFSCLLKR